MKNVLVTGSASGIGHQTAEMLAADGHRVVLHARNRERADAAATAIPGAAAAEIGDLASLDETRALAHAIRDYERFDAIIHNAAVYVRTAARRPVTADGLEETFQVNVVVPYLLTALVPLPRRLILISSGMAAGGEIVLDDLQRERRRWNPSGAYSDSKLCLTALGLALARRYPDVVTTIVGPGWVRTRMGGQAAPVDLETGAATQVWLAASDDPGALRSGRFLHHMEEQAVPPAATDIGLQDGLIAACERLTGASLPS